MFPRDGTERPEGGVGTKKLYATSDKKKSTPLVPPRDFLPSSYRPSFPAPATFPALINLSQPRSASAVSLSPFKVPSQLALLPPPSYLGLCLHRPANGSPLSLLSFFSPDLFFPLGTRPRCHFHLRYFLGCLHIWSHLPQPT